MNRTAEFVRRRLRSLRHLLVALTSRWHRLEYDPPDFERPPTGGLRPDDHAVGTGTIPSETTSPPTPPTLRHGSGPVARVVAGSCSSVARAIERIEDWHRAQRWYERAVRLDPCCLSGWLGIGRTCEQGGPTGPVADSRRGVVDGYVGDPERAAVAYDRAIELDPRCGAAWAGTLRARRRADDLGVHEPRNGVRAGRAAVEWAPTDPDVWFERAWSTVLAGRAAGGLTGGAVDEAIDDFERCLTLAPHHARARFHLVRIAIQFARWETAARAAWPDSGSVPLDLDAEQLERVARSADAPIDWLLVHAWRLHAAGGYRKAERVRTIAARRASAASGRRPDTVADVIEQVQGDIWLDDLERAALTLAEQTSRRRRPADAAALQKLAADVALRCGDVDELERWACRHAVAADPRAEVRFADLVHGRSVAVVGPAAPTVATGAVGAEIDGHDVVVRTKHVADLGLDASHGTRTEIAYYSDSSATLLTPQIRAALADGDIRLAVVRPSWLGVWRGAHFEAGTVRVAPFEDLGTFQASHFAVLRIVYDLLRYRPSAITLYHTNFFTAATPYASPYSFDQPLYDERSFARVVPMFGHDLAADFRFARSLHRGGLMEGDHVVERLLALPTDRYLAEVELATATRNGGPR